MLNATVGLTGQLSGAKRTATTPPRRPSGSMGVNGWGGQRERRRAKEIRVPNRKVPGEDQEQRLPRQFQLQVVTARATWPLGVGPTPFSLCCPEPLAFK